jgi:monofunctional biosynthetic peptidoglycan transglycosylase
VTDVAYLIAIWPNWDDYKQGAFPQSNFIEHYKSVQLENDWPELKWQPINYKRIPKDMVRAVTVAEDARFFSHSGVDLEAFKEVMKYNLSQKRFIFGGSTISQQTVKNMFLSPSRNPLRKWHELVITFGMERNLTKEQILELYLNNAEFGRGIYGVNAATKHYWGKPITRISERQAIELAATLPAPVNHNPKKRTKFFLNRIKKISRYF